VVGYGNIKSLIVYRLLFFKTVNHSGKLLNDSGSFALGCWCWYLARVAKRMAFYSQSSLLNNQSIVSDLCFTFNVAESFKK